MPRSSRSTLAILLVSLFFACGGLTSAETVLVPILISKKAGANGALWSTELSFRNGSSQSWIPGPGICQFPVPIYVPPESAMRSPICFNDEHGMFFSVPDEIAADVSFSLRVRDLNSESTSFGAEIPVIREREQLHGKSSIVDVPNRSGYRKTIRFVNLDKFANLTGALNIFSVGSDLSLTNVGSVQVNIPKSSHFLWPEGLTLSDSSGLPAIIPDVMLVFEFTPEGNSSYWWFASVASNTTNDVTIGTPQ